MGATTELEATIEVAERVVCLLDEFGIASAVIGAMALAARGYPRSTADFDLATCADPFRQLGAVAERLKVALGVRENGGLTPG
jgi:sugar phosphate isomerase/epimerase